MALIQKTFPDAFTHPDAVRVIQDGTSAAMNADMPVGLHVVMIPDLRNRKTHVFVIDSMLQVQAHNVIDYLTKDADELRHESASS